MVLKLRRFFPAVVSFSAVCTAPLFGWAAAPSVEQALKLAPIQKDVDYDVPAAAEIAKCTIKAEKIGGQTGWVVRGPAGEVLREFVDTDGDNVVDRWSYFKNGIEVYRDIDENKNGKADQHRWLNTAGIRWGVDRDEDGKIDAWKTISAEEVSAEVVLALRDQDVRRFQRVLLTPAEAKSLGLGPEKTKEIQEKITAAPAEFNNLLRRLKSINEKTTFAHFGASKPGVVPASSLGGDHDVVVYENVVAMIETGGKDGQVQIGTIVKVGDSWRVIDVPALPEGADQIAEARGFFFNTTYRGANAGQVEAADGISEQLQKTMEQLSKLEEAINRANSDSQLEKLNEQRADLLLQIADSIGEKDRPQWIRQFADTVSAAAQTGKYPAGVEKLKSLLAKLESNPADAAEVPYVHYRYLTADYGAKLQERGADFVKVQAEWLENLEKFAKEYPKSADTAEALLQLGIAEEFAGHEDKAKRWYGELIANFDTSPSAKKARGALTRLNSVGQPMHLRGKMLNGRVEDLSKYHGKHVLIHYWATWCEPCKVDIAQLKELQARYGKSGFALIGVSLDSTPAELNDYLGRNRLPWAQLWEQGGLDSRLANEMGILTLPTMILVDDQGKVINRNIHITELEGELKSRLK